MTDCERYKGLLRRWAKRSIRQLRPGRYECVLCRYQSDTLEEFPHAPGCLVGDTLRALEEDDD